MRILLAALLVMGFLASPPAAAETITVSASRGVPFVELASVESESFTEKLLVREVAVGALVVGGAFALGLAAGGGALSGALTAAGAVLIIYALLP